MFHIHSYYLEGGQWQAAVTVDSSSSSNNKYNINTAHVECKKKIDAGNNRGNWNHLKISQKIPQQHTGIARNQGTTGNSHTGHCTHISQSTKYKTFKWKTALHVP
jgi:hypothetical protein